MQIWVNNFITKHGIYELASFNWQIEVVRPINWSIGQLVLQLTKGCRPAFILDNGPYEIGSYYS
jgi:hypothetical protein